MLAAGQVSSPCCTCSSSGLLANILHLVVRADPDLAISAMMVFAIIQAMSLLSPSGDGAAAISAKGARA